jgi:hypothetical protein
VLKIKFTHDSSTGGLSTEKELTCTISSNCEYETTTSDTPTITSLSKSNSDTQLDITIANFSIQPGHTVLVYYGKEQASAVNVDSTTTVNATFSNGFYPGDVNVKISFEQGDRLTYSASYTQSTAFSATLEGPTEWSWAGGCELKIHGISLKEGANQGDITVEVCNTPWTIDLNSSTTDMLVVYTPAIITTHSLDTYNLEQPQAIIGEITSNPAEEGLNAFDGIYSTDFKSITTNNCYVQSMFPAGKVGRIQKI